MITEAASVVVDSLAVNTSRKRATTFPRGASPGEIGIGWGPRTPPVRERDRDPRQIVTERVTWSKMVCMRVFVLFLVTTAFALGCEPEIGGLCDPDKQK